MTEQALVEKYKQVEEELQRACREAGRDPSSVKLLAVSKNHPVERIQSLAQRCGHRIFGENYADELIKKSTDLKALALDWHFIGKLQSKKIRSLVAGAACIQTVESEKHLRLISRYAVEFQKTPYPVFIAVNAAGEPQKSGIPVEHAANLAKVALDFYPAIQVCGMMTVPPASYQDADYAEPPALYQQLSAASRLVGEGQLSLGMTGDLRIAVLAGSTMVRIGTAIFGERNYGDKPTS